MYGKQVRRSIIMPHLLIVSSNSLRCPERVWLYGRRFEDMHRIYFERIYSIVFFSLQQHKKNCVVYRRQLAISLKVLTHGDGLRVVSDQEVRKHFWNTKVRDRI